MICLGKGATGFISPSGSGISAFLISLRRYPEKETAVLSKTHTRTIMDTVIFQIPSIDFQLHWEGCLESMLFSSPNLILQE